MMLDLNQVRERALRIWEMAEDGQEHFSRKLVLTRLVTPLLQLVEAGMANRGGRWLTLEEAVTASDATSEWPTLLTHSRADHSFRALDSKIHPTGGQDGNSSAYPR